MKNQRSQLKKFKFGDFELQYSGQKPKVHKIQGKDVIRWIDVDDYLTYIPENTRVKFIKTDIIPEMLDKIFIDEKMNRYLLNGTKLNWGAMLYTIYPFEDPDSNEYGRKPNDKELSEMNKHLHELLNGKENTKCPETNPWLRDRKKPKQIKFGDFLFDYFDEKPEIREIGGRELIEYLPLSNRFIDTRTGEILELYFELPYPDDVEIDDISLFDDSIWMDTNFYLYNCIGSPIEINDFDMTSCAVIWNSQYNTIEEYEIHCRIKYIIDPDNCMLLEDILKKWVDNNEQT